MTVADFGATLDDVETLAGDIACVTFAPPRQFAQTHFSSEYLDVLHSERWRELRALVIAACDSTCTACGQRDRLDLHHRHYRTLGRETPDDVRALCRPCHRQIHGR